MAFPPKKKPKTRRTSEDKTRNKDGAPKNFGKPPKMGDEMMDTGAGPKAVGKKTPPPGGKGMMKSEHIKGAKVKKNKKK